MNANDRPEFIKQFVLNWLLDRGPYSSAVPYQYDVCGVIEVANAAWIKIVEVCYEDKNL